MGSTAPPNGIVLFSYASSPFGKRVSDYLQLRGIEYALCVSVDGGLRESANEVINRGVQEQPPIMPRPDLKKLGVEYRRIPILAIGRDVYLDTRLITRTLEERFPRGKLGSEKPEQQFVERLLERYMVEGPVFERTAGLVPPASLKDPKFAEDRKGFLGRSWKPEEMDRGRPECLLFVKNLFELLETTILADGRRWLLDTEKPSLADLQAIWPLDFATNFTLPPHVVSEQKFPKVFAWMSRLHSAVDNALSSTSEPSRMTGDEVVRYLQGFKGNDSPAARGVVDQDDAQSFEHGTRVEVYPADWGSEYRDSGRLVGLAPDEVTIMVEGAMELRIHAPRTGFKVTAVGGSESQGSTKL